MSSIFIPSRQDPFNLERFVSAQKEDYMVALSELRKGEKCSHWIWYIFPQIDGLVDSSTTKYFAIKSLDEAESYLAHQILGPRLLECAETLLAIHGKTISEIMGYPDDLKLKSSMTLFAQISQADSPFHRVLTQYFESKVDERTIELLAK